MQIAKPQPIAVRLKSMMVAMTAEGDFVTVANVLELPDDKNSGKTYSTISMTAVPTNIGTVQGPMPPGTAPLKQ